MNKKIFIPALTLFLAALTIGLYTYNKPHKNIHQSSTDFQIPAQTLLEAFENDENAANAKYLDKIIEVNGIIRTIDKGDEGQLNITLETGNELSAVVCQMDQLSKQDDLSLSEGQSVKLKGICTGMLMDVILVRCVLSKA